MEAFERRPLHEILGERGYIRGPFGSALLRRELQGRGIPVYEQQHAITGTRKFRYFVNEEKFNELLRFQIRPNDLIVSCSGTIGRISVVRPEDPLGIISQALLILRPEVERVLPEFLYYFLSTPEGRHALIQASHGSVQVNIAPRAVVEQIEIPVPSLHEQRAIAHILGALDDKIELNRRMNETLEEMARAIFKSWFVDFDPVRAKAEGRDPGLPNHIADLFPDRFEDSELGEIPAGWKMDELGEVVAIHDSKRVPLSGRERSQRNGPYPYYGATSVMDYVDDYLFDGIYVLVGEDGSVVTVDDHPFTQYVWGKLWVNNHAHVLQGKGSVSTEHLLLSLSQTNIRAHVTGAVQLKLNQRNMKSIPFMLSSSTINEAFKNRIAPLFERLRAGHEESQTLVTIRDALLPRLISGELRVGESERFVEAKL